VSISGSKHQSISVNVLGSNLPLCFIDYQWEGTRARPKNKSSSKYGFSWDYFPRDEIYDQRTHNTYREYEEFSVDVLRALIAESIVHVEEQIRRNAASAYEGLIERREEAIRLREVRRIAAIRRHEQAVQQLAEKRIQLMDDASSRIAHTDRLRSLIAAMDEKIQRATKPVGGYEEWRSWAVHHADLIDPRHMSTDHIEQWIAKFHLHQ